MSAAAPVGRETRVYLEHPNGRVLEPVAQVGAQFNADAAAPLRVVVETQCPCCKTWVKVFDQPVPNWGPDR